MDIQELLGPLTAEQTKELAVAALTIMSTDNATEAIVEYADAELEELVETLGDELQRQG